MDSQEWSDGVLAIKIRDCAESTTPNKKWISLMVQLMLFGLKT
jgi:hypothetical protein